MILKLFLALNILTAFQPFISQESPITSSKPEIKSIYTDYPKDGIWVSIPKGTKKITFHVEAENTETVLFWLIPTGTKHGQKENSLDMTFKKIKMIITFL